MRKIFILEDDDIRITWFRKEFSDFDLTIVKDAAQAIAILAKDKFSAIFLDHDLGGKQMVDSDEPNTGYQVAKIIPGSVNDNTPVIIHSYNENGAKRIFVTLSSRKAQVVWKPFGTFDKNLFYNC